MKIRKLGLIRCFQYLLVLAAFASLVLGSLGSLVGCRRRSMTGGNQGYPQDALKRFYDNQGPEDTLMDPLILAGDRVVPMVLKEVKNKNMPRRRYAIGFLGNGSYKEALAVIEPILLDPTEEDYIRGDALHSLYLIDASRGRELADRYKDQNDYLGEISRRVVSDDSQLKKIRTYAEALAGEHE